MTTKLVGKTVNKIITRKDYLDNENKDTSHEAYYAQFVTASLVQRVIGAFGKEKLIEGKNKSFNNIPLKKWDALSSTMPNSVFTKMKECGDYLTLAGTICILKEAARQAIQ